METPIVKHIRDTFRKADPDIAVALFCDNALLFDEAENAFIKWDDDNECFYAAMLNTVARNVPHKPIRITGGGYDIIQYIHGYTDAEGAPKILKEFGYTDQQIANIINYFDPQDERIYISAGREDVIAGKEKLLAKQAKEREDGLAEYEKIAYVQGLNSITDRVYNDHVNPDPEPKQVK